MAKAKIFANKKTKVAHGRTNNDACRESEILEVNRVYFETPEAALKAGYRLCKKENW